MRAGAVALTIVLFGCGGPSVTRVDTPVLAVMRSLAAPEVAELSFQFDPGTEPCPLFEGLTVTLNGRAATEAPSSVCPNLRWTVPLQESDTVGDAEVVLTDAGGKLTARFRALFQTVGLNLVTAAPLEAGKAATIAWEPAWHRFVCPSGELPKVVIAPNAGGSGTALVASTTNNQLTFTVPSSAPSSVRIGILPNCATDSLFAETVLCVPASATCRGVVTDALPELANVAVTPTQ